MKHRRVALTASAVVAGLCLLSLLLRGLNLGIDFTGGVIVEAAYPEAADLAAIRSELVSTGFETVQVQSLGTTSNVLIRLPPLEEDADIDAFRDRTLAILRTQNANVELRSFETVGPQVGEDLAEQASLAVLIALMMIFLYVMLRFHWKLALGAMVAELHDVLITVGLFSIVGWQFDVAVLGSVLAVLGYSINDKIVLYDRIRDNVRQMRRGTSETIVNASINHVLRRTLVTGVTTLLVLTALMVLAGDTLFGFSVAMFFGILVGTYSSIYVASAMALMLKVGPSDLVPAKRQPDDGRP